MRCYPEQCYTPPEGLCDFPFIYTYDVLTNALVNGNRYVNQRVMLDGDSEFILRAISGMYDCLNPTGSLQFYDATRRQFFSNEAKFYNTPIWLVLPEVRYPRAANIAFDVTDVANLQAAVYEKLHFQGVKRFPSPYNNPKPSTYDWKNFPYDWIVPTITLPANSLGIPKTYQLKVETCDFELQQIRAVDATLGTASLSRFAMRIWNAEPRCLMDSPILDMYLIGNWDGMLTLGPFPINTFPFTQSFPNPPILYPVNSQITFELTPQTNLAVDIQLMFRGIQRWPV